MTTQSANQVTMNRHYSIFEVSEPVRPVKPLDQRHSKFSWVSCLDIVPFLFAFVFFFDMVKKARCLPCDFFFLKIFRLTAQVMKSVKPMKKKKVYRPSKPHELKKASCNRSNNQAACQLLNSISSLWRQCEDLMKLRVSKAIRKACMCLYIASKVLIYLTVIELSNENESKSFGPLAASHLS